MANIYYDNDADIERLDDITVAVIGYGSQGHAHALNLADSGVDVVVGLREDSSSRDKVEADGLKVANVSDAVASAQLVMILTPDEVMAPIYQDEIAPHLEEGDVLAFAHGFNIHYGAIEPPEGNDVIMVAPKGPGHLVRRTFEEGSGVPCLLAVHQDVSGEAKGIALAYASAIGGGRAGVLETTFAEETETDLFGEQVILCGGISELIKSAFTTLVEAGYQPESAYFETLHELKLIVDLLYEGGMGWMRNSISNTAEYGDYTRGPRIVTDETRAEMRKVLDEIQSGAFANEWLGQAREGAPHLHEQRRLQRELPIEQVGRELRNMMPFIEEKTT